MFNEIRFSEYVDSGEIVDKINLPDFFKVYLNHRPPFGNTMRAIQKSFNILGDTNSEGKKVIRREDFLKLLLTKGDPTPRDVIPTAESWVWGDRSPPPTSLFTDGASARGMRLLTRVPGQGEGRYVPTS